VKMVEHPYFKCWKYSVELQYLIILLVLCHFGRIINLSATFPSVNTAFAWYSEEIKKKLTFSSNK
jgi:hypothetical protein